MPPTSAAEEHLRVIRSLMEKATIYRAISGQAALLGGVLACLAGGLLAGRHDPFIALLSGQHVSAANADVFGFQLKWCAVLALAGGSNFLFLFREARKREDLFVSPGMRLACRAMLPPLLCGAVFTSLGVRENLPPFWLLFYGLALLSTAHFAPTSLVRLGWAFLLSGLTLLMVDARSIFHLLPASSIPNPAAQASASTPSDWLMACTFGAYHLVYAVATLSRRRTTAHATEPEV